MESSSFVADVDGASRTGRLAVIAVSPPVGADDSATDRGSAWLVDIDD
jgi:hypothetical protein